MIRVVSDRRFRSILCVDDQRLVHQFHESMLTSFVAEGVRILHAYNGAEALRLMAEAGDVDLVLLDINMPVLNGLAFLEQKLRTGFAAVPVIVLSTEGDRPEEIAHAISLGAVSVLSKTLGFEELDLRIRAIAIGQG